MCVKPSKNGGTDSFILAECVRGPVAIPLSLKLLFFGENLATQECSWAYSAGKVISGCLRYEFSLNFKNLGGSHI